MIKKKLYFLIFMLIFVVSCDYEAKEHYIIDNKSSYDINVVYVKKYNNEKNDSTKVIVSPNMTKDFYENTTATAVAKDKGENYLDIFDSIYISINDTLILNKDLYNMDNWDYWHKGKRDSESRFTFTINNSDLKNKTK